MVIHRSSILAVLTSLGLLAVGYWAAGQWGYLDRLKAKLLPRPRVKVKLSSGDFPAGVSAPVGDIASVPLRPTLIGFTPRGSSSALLLATGGIRSADLESPERVYQGLLKTAYAMEARAVVFVGEASLKKAFTLGGDNGGVDVAALSVDRLAQWSESLRDAAPRSVLLLGRSRVQEALAAVGIQRLAELKGRRLGAYTQGTAYYFALWVLSRVGIPVEDVQWVELTSTLEAGAALREGRADAVTGLFGDVDLAARDRGGKVLVSTSDAPHLLSTVLVVRGEFAARYPDAVRRLILGILDGATIVAKGSIEAARLLGEVAPYLGDPVEAIQNEPPANLKDNLAFFALSGQAPVTYDELYQSAAALFVRMGRTRSPPSAEETRDLGPLKYISQTRRP